jgi:GNAT superfamily N-acetyltransferase
MGTIKKEKRMAISSEVSPEEYQRVCRGLFQYNVDRTNSLLKKPGLDIRLIVKDDQDQVFGGVFCDTFLYCLYIDVLWVDEQFRGEGYGKALMLEAERIARESGCTFAHTCTFSYQSLDFYQHLSYQIFGVIDDYPENIKQYFLKKKL